LFSDVKKTRKTEYLFYAGCLVRLLLSVQIDADWSDTSEAMNSEKVSCDSGKREIFSKAWDNYNRYMDNLRQRTDAEYKTVKEREINAVRTEIQKECLHFSEKPCGIYCLPIPTGAGKTLTALGYALKYAREHFRDEDEMEHIFYISPYISITEQNAQVIKEAVGNPEWVLEHHSNIMNSDENDFDTAWEDTFICTTMVQFLNTLFSDRKKSIRRFHQLKKSIVIIDEVQSLPVKTLHTFNLMMNFLNRVCKTDIILCTATQPALDSVYIKRKICYSEPQNMISNLNLRYEQFDRVEIVPEFTAGMETMQGLADKVAAEFAEVQSVLVIFNKKQTVSDFYDRMRDRLENVDIYYLTTNLCAEHRGKLIYEIRDKCKDTEKKVLIVSTNLIEAGVDLSVARVYRSLAGIDSIAQAAGRCNRNGEMKRGQVVVFEMKEDEPGRGMEELLTAQQKTKEIQYRYEKAGKKQSILFPEWVKQYYDIFYEELQYKMDFALKKEYQGNTILGLLSTGFEGINYRYPLNQAFCTAGKMYQVIADTGVTVVVPYGEGEKLIEELEQTQSKADIYKCLRKLQRYTVSVYYDRKEDLLERGVIRESLVLPGIYIALGYDETKGLGNVLLDAIF
jgi:CRISPR-associated endonuclease/helicase Cas3